MNPLSHIVSDKQYRELKPFLNPIAVRNFWIQREYWKLKFNHTKKKCAKIIAEKNNLDETSIYKIVYSKTYDRRKR